MSVDTSPFHDSEEFQWDIGVGPAISLPNVLKTIQLRSKLRIEFLYLEVSNPRHANHVVAVVVFKKPLPVNVGKGVVTDLENGEVIDVWKGKMGRKMFELEDVEMVYEEMPDVEEGEMPDAEEGEASDVEKGDSEEEEEPDREERKLTDIVEGNATYYAARISMELPYDSSLKVVEVDEDGATELGAYFHQFLSAGHHYWAGRFTVQLLKHRMPSTKSLKNIRFRFTGALTLGDVVDLVINERMHEFTFLSYDGKWKGCRDFILQMRALLVRRSKLEKLPVGDDTLFCRAIQVCYHPDHSPVVCLVLKGCWLRYNRLIDDEDGLVLSNVYSAQKEDD